MVRTKADPGAKAVGGKSTRKPLPPSSAGGSSDNKAKHGGGNPYCPRETPSWQKEITKFFTSKPDRVTEDAQQSNGDGSSQSGSNHASTSSHIEKINTDDSISPCPEVKEKIAEGDQESPTNSQSKPQEEMPVEDDAVAT
ncbi:PCNA-associated factor isoform X2 [Anabrus simplex]|uniref:PCNA-associated factor isoform X2 n=1 Tax=Anabrus simplex TaxID=316456 RepID=UPI0034DD5B22